MSRLRSPGRAAAAALATLAALGLSGCALPPAVAVATSGTPADTPEIAGAPEAAAVPPLPRVQQPPQPAPAAAERTSVDAAPAAAPSAAAPAGSVPLQTGIASHYGHRFHGRRTANGERYDMRAHTAAHRALPFGSLVEVRNPANGRSLTVRINDRGPHIRGRIIDLSHAAARALGIDGLARVELHPVHIPGR